MITASFGAQIFTFLISLAMGAAICLLYDLFRIFRLCVKCGGISVFVQDMLFFTTSALLTFFLLMVRCNGELRLYVFAGEIFGFIIFHITVSRVIMKISSAIVKSTKKMIAFISRKFYRPLRSALHRVGVKLSVRLRSFLDKLLNIADSAKKGLKQRAALMYNQHRKKRDVSETDAL